MLAVSATKADRFVAEMREIAATQASVGLTPALFEAMAEVYEDVARSAIAAEAPRRFPPNPTSRTSWRGSRLAEPQGAVRPGCQSAGERT